jgi:hypothetical protein
MPLLSITALLLAVAAELPTDPAATVRTFVEAYNARDYSAFSAMLAEDAHWYSVNGKQISIDGEGAAAIVAQTRKHLERCTACRSELLSASASGRFVTTIERASWSGADGRCVSQSSPAVYEIADGRIRAVWYYPASGRTPCRQ